MTEKIKELGEILVRDSTRLRMEFHEVARGSAEHKEGPHYLTLDGIQLGRDFEYYTLLSNLKGEPEMLTLALEELVLPLKAATPISFDAGLAYMERQKNSFGELKDEWVELIHGLSRELSIN